MQEFEDRQVYEFVEDVLLIGTSTCPKCKQAEKILDDAGISFTKILAENNTNLVTELNIMQAPTLVIGEKKYAGISEIYKFINER